MEVPLNSPNFEGNTLEFYLQTNIYNLLAQLYKTVPHERPAQQLLI